MSKTVQKIPMYSVAFPQLLSSYVSDGFVTSSEPILVSYCYPKSILCPDCFRFSVPFPGSSQDSTLDRVPVCPWASLGWDGPSDFSCVESPRQFWVVLVRYLAEYPSILVHLLFSSYQTGASAFWEKDHRLGVPFSSHCTDGTGYQHGLLAMMLSSMAYLEWHWLVRFLHRKITLSPLSGPYALPRSH